MRTVRRALSALARGAPLGCSGFFAFIARSPDRERSRAVLPAGPLVSVEATGLNAVSLPAGLAPRRNAGLQPRAGAEDGL